MFGSIIFWAVKNQSKMKQSKSKKPFNPTQKPIGIVLSGGGGRALVHLGIWKALEEKGRRMMNNYIWFAWFLLISCRFLDIFEFEDFI